MQTGEENHEPCYLLSQSPTAGHSRKAAVKKPFLRKGKHREKAEVCQFTLEPDWKLDGEMNSNSHLNITQAVCDHLDKGQRWSYQIPTFRFISIAQTVFLPSILDFHLHFPVICCSILAKSKETSGWSRLLNSTVSQIWLKILRFLCPRDHSPSN